MTYKNFKNRKDELESQFDVADYQDLRRPIDEYDLDKLIGIIQEYQELTDNLLDALEEKKTEEPCIILVQNMLRDFPECKKRLAYVLLEIKYQLEEGIGQKE